MRVYFQRSHKTVSWISGKYDTQLYLFYQFEKVKEYTKSLKENYEEQVQELEEMITNIKQKVSGMLLLSILNATYLLLLFISCFGKVMTTPNQLIDLDTV